jgi:hypothetical protein
VRPTGTPAALVDVEPVKASSLAADFLRSAVQRFAFVVDNQDMGPGSTAGHRRALRSGPPEPRSEHRVPRARIWRGPSGTLLARAPQNADDARVLAAEHRARP